MFAALIVALVGGWALGRLNEPTLLFSGVCAIFAAAVPEHSTSHSHALTAPLPGINFTTIQPMIQQYPDLSFKLEACDDYISLHNGLAEMYQTYVPENTFLVGLYYAFIGCREEPPEIARHTHLKVALYKSKALLSMSIEDLLITIGAVDGDLQLARSDEDKLKPTLKSLCTRYTKLRGWDYYDKIESENLFEWAGEQIRRLRIAKHLADSFSHVHINVPTNNIELSLAPANRKLLAAADAKRDGSIFYLPIILLTSSNAGHPTPSPPPEQHVPPSQAKMLAFWQHIEANGASKGSCLFVVVGADDHPRDMWLAACADQRQELFEPILHPQTTSASSSVLATTLDPSLV